MPEIINTAFSRLKSTWRQVLAVHLCYTGLGIILFAPLLGVLGQALLKLSGKPALADMDLLFFALSPVGAFAFILFMAISIVVSVFELASLMAIGLADASGKRADVLASLMFSLRRVVPIFKFAGWLVVKLLIMVAPFLVAAAAVAYFFISDHDINYYLAVQPPEFWTAVVAVGLIALVMTALLIYRLVGWSLALPLVLFTGTTPAHSFAASEKLTRFNRSVILGALVVWAIASFLLGAVITGCVQLLAHWLVPLFLDSVNLLAILFGLLTALWTIASVFATALIAGGLALLLTALAYRLSPDFQAVRLPRGQQSGHAFARKVRYRFVIALTVAVGSAAFIGYGLLEEIEIVDDVQIIAHRGAAGAAPENTMASIRRAIVDGADWIEIDVQETADGEVVVIHDSDFMKLANKNLRVWDATMEQLAEIDVGSWFAPGFSGERVPTLAEVLAKVKGHSRLIIELKYYGHDQQLEQRVIDLVEAAGMQNDTMIMSLQFAGIQKVRELRPDWKVGLLAARAAGDLMRLDADFLAVNMAMAHAGRIRTAHAADKELFVWTVNDALSMSQLMSLGVDGIITDEPRLGREVLAARAELSTVERLLLHMAPLLGFEAPALSFESNDAESAATDPGPLLESLPEPLTNNAVAEFTHNGVQYVMSFMGLGPGKEFDDISKKAWLWRSDTAAWEAFPDVPVEQGRLAAVAVGLYDRVLLFGGYTVAPDGTEKSTPEVFIINPLDGSYKRRADMPVPVDDAVAFAYANRYIYLVSGWHDEGNVSHVQVYDSWEDSWAMADSFPGVPVFGHAGGIVGNQFVIVGGVGVLGNKDGKRQFGVINQAWLGEIDQ